MTPNPQADLLAAIVDEQPGAVVAAIEAGADPNEPLPGDARALHVAITFHASPRVIQALLDQGADPDMPSAAGIPALVAAITTGPDDGNVDTVKLLLDAGASVDEPGPDGKSALEVARVSGGAETLALLNRAAAEAAADAAAEVTAPPEDH